MQRPRFFAVSLLLVAVLMIPSFAAGLQEGEIRALQRNLGGGGETASWVW